MAKKEISVCWLRRDLRLDDQAALYHALRSKYPVLLFFIFDKNILGKLPDETDARITFIHQSLTKLQAQILEKESSLYVKYNEPEKAWQELLAEFEVKEIYTNHDYEPYARQRDEHLSSVFQQRNIPFFTYKDQVIFEKNEVVKPDGKPYTVFTPYSKAWLNKLNDFYIKSYPVERYLKNLLNISAINIPSLKEIGFKRSPISIPDQDFERKIADYDLHRDFPATDSTTRIGVHLRFGTLSIRRVVKKALEQKASKWLSELIWREFYFTILWHFPHTAHRSFKPAYDKIQWRNNELEFKAWCEGKTGYPLVDAGMRQLNETGFMHNRVRMVVASFLCKHLLIDWRWGEAYFAEKLLDYEQASNVGGWQWACGSGNDAAPYFRVFNPTLQLQRFDPKMEYVYHWAPEYRLAIYPVPIVEHTFARDRVLNAFKKALS